MSRPEHRSKLYRRQEDDIRLSAMASEIVFRTGQEKEKEVSSLDIVREALNTPRTMMVQ
jgi:hypothetical protein